MTHYLDTFTELFPRHPALDEVKARFLREAEAIGMAEFLRQRAISQKTVEHRVREEVSEFMTADVAGIVEQRGLVNHDQIALLSFVHEDPDEDFVAAVRDAGQVSFVYQAAGEHHRKQAGQHDRALKTAGPKEDVQRIVSQLATTHPALAGPPTMHALDEMIAELHASAPWMRDLSTWVYKALRAQYVRGQT